MIQSNYRRRRQQPYQSPDYSSAGVNGAATNPPRMAEVKIICHSESYRDPKQWQMGRHLNPYLKPKPQAERGSRLDPPGYLTIRPKHPPHHSPQEKYPSNSRRPSAGSSQSQPLSRKPREQGRNLLPLSRELKPIKSQRRHPSSPNHQSESQLRHQEWRHSRPEQEYHASHNSQRRSRLGKSPPKSSMTVSQRRQVESEYSNSPCTHQGTSQTKSQRRRAEDLDGFGKQHDLHCHPAKSSSFQVHPRQLLQVYEDLRHQIKLELKTIERKDAEIDDDENSPIIQDHEWEDDRGDSSIDVSDTDSLAVLTDSEDDGTGHPEKDHSLTGTFPGKLMDAGNTSMSVSSTASDVTTVAVNRLKRQHRVKNQTDGIISTDHSDDEENFNSTAPHTFSTKAGNESSSQDSIGIESSNWNYDTDEEDSASTSYPTSRMSTLIRSIKSPTFPFPPDTNYRLIEKQIKYLHHEKQDTVSLTQSSPQQIIYPAHWRPTTREVNIQEMRRRREIIHSMMGTRKNHISLNNHTGRRSSFS